MDLKLLEHELYSLVMRFEARPAGHQHLRTGRRAKEVGRYEGEHVITNNE